MKKILTNESFIDKQCRKINNREEPSQLIIENILNYSKSTSVKKVNKKAIVLHWN